MVLHGHFWSHAAKLPFNIFARKNGQGGADVELLYSNGLEAVRKSYQGNNIAFSPGGQRKTGIFCLFIANEPMQVSLILDSFRL